MVGIFEVQSGKPVALSEKIPKKIDPLPFQVMISNERIQFVHVDGGVEFPCLFTHQKYVDDRLRREGDGFMVPL